MLAACDTEARILDGAPKSHVIAELHRQQMVLDPAHQQALLGQAARHANRRAAAGSQMAVPESAVLLERAFADGESAGHEIAHLLQLLDRYGPPRHARAVPRLSNATRPRACLGRSSRCPVNRATPLPLDLQRHPQD